jgi:Carboxypeptidase regulatory-like domain
MRSVVRVIVGLCAALGAASVQSGDAYTPAGHAIDSAGVQTAVAAAESPQLRELRVLDYALQDASARPSDWPASRTAAALQAGADLLPTMPVGLASVDPELHRKWLAVEALRQRVELQSRALPGSSARAADAPTLEPVPYQIGSGVADRCERALRFSSGQAISVDAKAGQSLWLRVDAQDGKSLRLTTRGSHIDAALSVFDDCRNNDKAPLRYSDDAFGLQAEVLLVPRNQSFWYVRLDNLSGPGNVQVEGIGFSGFSGRVTRASDGTGIYGLQVAAHTDYGSSIGYTTGAVTDANGYYDMPVPAGTYVLRTGLYYSSNESLVHEAYQNHACFSNNYYSVYDCGDTALFTRVVMSGASVTGLDFALDPGAAVSGRVIAADSGLPIANATVMVGAANAASSGLTDALGRYRITHLFPQTMYANASAAGFDAQYFGGAPCPPSGCNTLGGDPIALSSGQSASADFSLARQAFLPVQLTVGGQPPTSGYVTVDLLNSNGAVVATTSSHTDGLARLGPLQPGSYRLRARIAGATYWRLFPNVNCSDSCVQELSQGATIIVSDTQPEAVAIDLVAWPRIVGQLLDETTGAPLTDAFASIYSPVNGYIYVASTDIMGRYTFNGVEPGSYLLLFSSNRHVNEAYPDVPCERPNPLLDCLGAQLIVASQQNPLITADAALTASPRIRGRISNATSNNISSQSDFCLFSPTGTVLKCMSYYTPVPGNYELTDVVEGDIVLGHSGYYVAPQLYDGVECPENAYPVHSQCNWAAADLLPARANGVLESIDFRLRPIGAKRVLVRDQATGQPLNMIAIDLWRADGSRSETAFTDDRGQAWMAGAPFSQAASFRVSTGNIQGYVDEVYDNILCPLGSVFDGLCSLTGAATVLLPTPTGDTSAVVIDLLKPGQLFAAGFE